jgi:hypothetical protein
MIEPTSKDTGRAVEYDAGNGTRAKGTIVSFGADLVTVRPEGDGPNLAMRRESLWWPSERRAGLKSELARQLLTQAGVKVTELDGCWDVEGFLYRPEVGAWRRPDGSPGYGEPSRLIVEIRAREKRSQDPDAAA